MQTLRWQHQAIVVQCSSLVKSVPSGQFLINYEAIICIIFVAPQEMG